jgi:hypothetical protein
MIAQVPLTLELYDRVVSRPAYHRIKDHTLIAERSVRRIANGIAEIVAITSRVREIILAVILVHPRGFEETVRITSLHGLAVLIKHNHSARRLCELLYIVAHTNHTAVDGRRIGSSEEFTLMIRSCTQVDKSVLVAILAIDRC